MRVLVATFTYPPNADGVSEASRVLAEGLASRGHEVKVVTSARPERVLNPGANPTVFQFNIDGSRMTRGGITGDIEAYQEFLLASDAEVVVFECWDMWPMAAALPILDRLNAKKVLVSHCYTAHQWLPHPRFPWGIGTWLRGLPLVLKTPSTLRQFDHLVVLSRRARFDRFFDHWIAKATGYRSCSVIPNGAFSDEFQGDGRMFREAYNVGSGSIILCVANYSDRKNQVMALRAFRKAGLRDATLVFIGSEFNEFSEQLMSLDQELCKSHPLGTVRILQKVNREMTCSAYCAADLFLLSAKHETQPIVLLEAMASKTPWVSTRTGCVSELPGGIVVDSEAEMSQTLRRLLTNSKEHEELIGAGLLATCDTYDWRQVIAAYESLFFELLQRGRPPADRGGGSRR